ncbi:hypothetical protein PFISCL1PPCAC_14171, partial [Pristionchus fissidentatus]
MRGKRVKNVVDEFKGHVSHFDAPLEVVNPFAVKRADGHRRRGRGRKNCHGERKHTRREERQEDEEECEEREEKEPKIDIEILPDFVNEDTEKNEIEENKEESAPSSDQSGQFEEIDKKIEEEEEETGDELRGEEERDEKKE